MVAFAPQSAPARRDLAVAWMNRGHEWMLRNNTAGLARALPAYGKAILILRSLPWKDQPSWANSLGAAWMNRGLLLHRLHGTGRFRAALACFDRAIEILRQLPAGENPWPRRNLTGSHLNRASLLLDLARPAEARTDAFAALQLSAPHECADPVDAELSLKARRALCDALGQLIVAPGADQDSLASEASDLVDDALELIRRREAVGANRFHALALRFFRFGARLYRQHQLQFLPEFLNENFSCALPESRAIAHQEAALALRARPAQPFFFLNDPGTERRIRIERELGEIHFRLSPTAPCSS